jgi:hypothetical protein
MDGQDAIGCDGADNRLGLSLGMGFSVPEVPLAGAARKCAHWTASSSQMATLASGAARRGAVSGLERASLCLVDADQLQSEWNPYPASR